MSTAEQERSPTTRAKRRIPRFKTVEEAAQWFDTHDTSEYEDEFEGVAEDIRFVVTRARPKKAITVRLEEETLEALTQAAREKGVGPSTLARMWIREHLGKSRGRDSSAPGA
jgi:predicted DNA binding CopG/RHH family protein